MHRDAEHKTGVDASDRVGRPRDQLLNYSVKHRWELTRRNPYYVGLWEEVRRYWRRPSGDSAERRDWGHAAKTLLGAIGVFAEPVPPGTPFEELMGADADPSFLCGSLQPITFRALATLFFGQLEAPARAFVASLLRASAENEQDTGQSAEARKIESLKILNELLQKADAALDRVPGNPVFIMHLGASQASIVEDANDQARRWKAKMKSGTKRIHTDKIELQLEVWDRFEGWNGSGYDHARAQKLAGIAADLQLGISTVYSRYKAAFECVVGQPFCPEVWWRVFGPLKFSKNSAESVRSYAGVRFRRMQSPSRRPVPETTIKGKGSSGGDEEGGYSILDLGSVGGDGDVLDLFADVLKLIEDGLTDAEISKKLDLDRVETVAAIRGREVELCDLV